MKVKFSLYNGLSGDPHFLLTGVNENGHNISKLYDTVSWFKYFRLKRLKSKILKEFELKTGSKHYEKV